MSLTSSDIVRTLIINLQYKLLDLMKLGQSASVVAHIIDYDVIRVDMCGALCDVHEVHYNS